MYDVYLGLGSNFGDRLEHLSKAAEEIGKIARIKKISSVYETAPVGMNSKHLFYNLVMEIETSLDPPILLEQLKSIETKVGRTSMARLQDREIDIDILLYEGLQYADETLTVPHRELGNRRFVLEPFSEIAPENVHPTSGATIATLLTQCKDHSYACKTELSIERIHTN